MNCTSSFRLGIGLLLALLLAGCTAAHYRKSADADAYRTIRQKTALVTNMDPQFTIEQTNRLSLEGLPVCTNVAESLGPDGERERGARILRLQDALAMAIEHSRSYQSRKEDLYLAALTLTFARHQFTPILSGNVSAEFKGVANEITRTNGSGTNATVSIAFLEEDSVRGNGTLKAEW